MKYRLTKREEDVVKLFAEGCTAKDISNRLKISIHTVRTYSKSIITKLGAKNITHAVAMVTVELL